MGTAMTIDLEPLARNLKLQKKQIQTVVELLDSGNTVPFITRYRKDQTGGLDEVKIRQIHQRVGELRQLAQRKQTILRSIESQGKLNPEIAKQIETIDNMKQLEDLYLPFKPKKQTLAAIAQQRGLGPLANEILSAFETCKDLEARAADYVDEDKKIPTIADVQIGVGHILSEQFSESSELRQRLRWIMKRTGKLVSKRTGKKEKEAEPAEVSKQSAQKTDVTFDEKSNREAGEKTSEQDVEKDPEKDTNVSRP